MTTASAAGATAPADATKRASFSLAPHARTIFIGLMLGMLVASVSQTIVSPAMPVIVAELGGMEHYSWLATSAMLASAVIVPIVGKLSDLYGRRPFYIAGLIVFMCGSAFAGLSQEFWMLIVGRIIQGIGMGTLMPLSQIIIGDIIPPRQRGKYQGIMGAIFGVTSIAGPLVGGFITDNWGWRWLFYVGIPFGVVALVFIIRFLHMPHERREAKIDVAGISLLSVALVAILLATSWGGTTYPWGSAEVIGLYALGAVLVAIFIPVEMRAAEPVLPLHMFRNRTFTFSNIASLAVAMGMFGAIFYIPVYAQGVMKASVTNSGLVIIPMSVAMILVSIAIGLLITKTGKYKPFMMVGTLVILAGYLLLTQLQYGDPQWRLTVCMVVVGVGLGATMQTYTLVVQNTADPKEMGIATAATQFFRSAGGTVGIAILGTVMTSRMGTAIASHMPPELAGQVPAGDSGGTSAGSVLDPDALAELPDPVAEAIRMGMADALHTVFVVGVPLVLVAVIATAFIKAVPLRETLHNTPKETVEKALEDSAAEDSAEDRAAEGAETVAVPAGARPAQAPEGGSPPSA